MAYWYPQYLPYLGYYYPVGFYDYPYIGGHYHYKWFDRHMIQPHVDYHY